MLFFFGNQVLSIYGILKAKIALINATPTAPPNQIQISVVIFHFLSQTTHLEIDLFNCLIACFPTTENTKFHQQFKKYFLQVLQGSALIRAIDTSRAHPRARVPCRVRSIARQRARAQTGRRCARTDRPTAADSPNGHLAPTAPAWRQLSPTVTRQASDQPAVTNGHQRLVLGVVCIYTPSLAFV